VDMYSLGTVVPPSVCGFLSIVDHLHACWVTAVFSIEFHWVVGYHYLCKVPESWSASLSNLMMAHTQGRNM